jgi:hypothetical protein
MKGGRAKKEAVKPATLAEMSDNQYNRHGYDVGDFSEVSQILATYTKFDKEQLLNKLEHEATTLYEVSYGLYFLAMRYMQQEAYQDGFRYLRIAADDYLNPLAMVKLARVYYHGAQKMNIPPEVEITREEDLVSAYYYITLAFQIGGVITDSFGKNKVLDAIVNSGLALLDTFNLPDIKKKLAADSAESTLLESVPEKVRIYREMYLGDK